MYTLPEQLPPILISSAGDEGTTLAGEVGDGLVGLVLDPGMIELFRESGGVGKPTYGQVHVCWDEDEGNAIETALEWWPNAGVPGNLFIELPLSSHFEEASGKVGPNEIRDSIVCGSDPKRHIAAIREFAEAGFSHVYVHQVGPVRPGFFEFYAGEVLPALREA